MEKTPKKDASGASAEKSATAAAGHGVVESVMPKVRQFKMQILLDADTTAAKDWHNECRQLQEEYNSPHVHKTIIDGSAFFPALSADVKSLKAMVRSEGKIDHEDCNALLTYLDQRLKSTRKDVDLGRAQEIISGFKPKMVYDSDFRQVWFAVTALPFFAENNSELKETLAREATFDKSALAPVEGMICDTVLGLLPSLETQEFDEWCAATKSVTLKGQRRLAHLREFLKLREPLIEHGFKCVMEEARNGHKYDLLLTGERPKVSHATAAAPVASAQRRNFVPSVNPAKQTGQKPDLPSKNKKDAPKSDSSTQAKSNRQQGPCHLCKGPHWQRDCPRRDGTTRKGNGSKSN